MNYPKISRILPAVAMVGGLLLGTSAAAKKTISLKLHNQTPSTKMTCQVHKVVTNSSGSDVKTLLKTFNVKPKNQRSASVENRPQSFSMAVRYIVKRINGTVVYPRLQLTCELAGQNSKNHSPEWDHADKDFSTHRFYGGCRSGAYCSTRVERR